MDTNKKIPVEAIGAAVVIGGIAIGLLLSRTSKGADLSIIHTEAATGAPRETLPAATQASETEETAEGQEGAASSVPASIETYISGGVSTQYPAMDQIDGASEKDKVDELLKTDALSFIEVNDIDEANDTLDIKCKMISAGRRRLIATYADTLSTKGVAHPTNLFYSNTVNLLQTQNLGLDDLTDAYTMAEYVFGGGVKLSGISSDVETQVLNYRSSIGLDFLTAAFSSVDFPLSSGTQRPESFSYEKQGTIYFSLSVLHTLGDYVLITSDPTIK